MLSRALKRRRSTASEGERNGRREHGRGRESDGRHRRRWGPQCASGAQQSTLPAKRYRCRWGASPHSTQRCESGEFASSSCSNCPHRCPPLLAATLLSAAALEGQRITFSASRGKGSRNRTITDEENSSTEGSARAPTEFDPFCKRPTAAEIALDGAYRREAGGSSGEEQGAMIDAPA
jgi:hypothetical protein